jgi:antitoxin (DNA-binding transcriptional repressor) of toxin-antitoxin stability system
MKYVTIEEISANFPSLLANAEAGEDIIIARDGKDIARLTRLPEHQSPIRFGVLKGKITVSDDFDMPLPDEVVAFFE